MIGCYLLVLKKQLKFYTGFRCRGQRPCITILVKICILLISLISAWYDHQWINVYESKTINDIKSHNMNSNFEEIFQGWLEKEEYNRNKGFLKKSKYWKKYFCVLRRYEGDSNVYLQWFEKEEEWRKEFPKGTFALFPKYSVYKHKTDKSKSYFEISNDEEAHYFLANNEKTMDLWVIQLMMQTRLNSSMIESSFRVKGGESKDLQRIGAKNLNCLLHLSEWGITLALERTHSVLSQWPLTTIRNYECSDNNEFMFEAGRKSPMGEGKYEFLTINSEDNAIFDQLDHFTSLRASRVRSAGGRNRLNSANDDEIAQAYGQLRWSVMLTKSQLNLGVIHSMPSQPQAIARNQAVYNHLDRKPSIQTSSSVVEDSYNRLDRTGSLNDQLSWERSYSRLNCDRTTPSRAQSQRSGREKNISDSYDHLERTTSFNGSPSSADCRSRSFGSVEGRSRFHFPSPPAEESYNHLARARHASLPSSTSPQKQMDFYNKLDRSMANVHLGSDMNSYDRLDSMQDQGTRVDSYDRLDSMRDQGARVDSYDRLDSMRDQGTRVDSYDRLGNMRDQGTHVDSYDHLGNMQGSIMLDKDMGMSPPLSSNDPNAYDTFGNLKAHTPTSYPFVKPGLEAPLVVELPPPLPQKPSFMSKSEKKSVSDPPPVTSPRNKPLPPRPDLNGEDKPELPTKSRKFSDLHQNEASNGDTSEGANLDQHYQSVDNEKTPAINGTSQDIGSNTSHYQTVDDKVESENNPTGVDTNGSHYQAVDDQKLEPEYDEPRGRLNTHSSNPDLTKIPGGKGKLDPSKRNTLHRSAPSLALYSTVNKKSKGSPKLTKSGSTFKLFKKIGRSSKKDEESYEKIPRKSKKTAKKDSSRVVSTSSLKPLITEDDAVSYVDIDGEERALARNLMDRRDSKRPLPDLPGELSGV